VSFVPAPNQSSIQTALWSFLTNILPSGTEVVLGQQNRVPEPTGPDFVVFTPMRRERLSTNVDVYADCAFTASISETGLDVTAVQFGIIGIGNTLFGVNVTATTILTQLTGPTGGAGTYTLSQSQTVASEVMASGVKDITQPTRLTFQVDVHGPNSADNAQTISTLFRDSYAAIYFKENGFAGISPLYADDPRQAPFLDGEQAYEDRWIIEAVLQADQTVTVPQQFASSTKLTFVNVLAAYQLA
jgi:hypothetical protein